MISMCVLSFERLMLLRKTIVSMLETSVEPFELIVHDDGSRQPEIGKWLAAMLQDGTVSHVILNPPGHNEGQGIAVNRMFSMAKGDILVKCDQDLTFKPGWQDAIHMAFDCNERDMRREGHWRAKRIGALGLFHYHLPPVDAAEMLIQTHTGYEVVMDFCGSLVAVPRSAWERFGPWDERSPAFAEDNTFKLEISDSKLWCCALTPEDFVVNNGFGIGPSTVVTAPDRVQAIKDGPKLVGG